MLTVNKRLFLPTGLSTGEGSGSDVDLGNYPTRSEVSNEIATATSTLASVTWVNNGLGLKADTSWVSAQLSAAINGLNWKRSVRGVIGNESLSGIYTTADLVTLVHGDRVLRNSATNSHLNGIYVVNQFGSWSRSSDANTADLILQAAVACREGAQFGDKFFLNSTDNITLNVTGLTFIIFAQALAYSAGTGIGISSAIISVDLTVVQAKLVAGSGITLGGTNGQNISVDYTAAQAKLVAGTGITLGGTNGQNISVDLNAIRNQSIINHGSTAPSTLSFAAAYQYITTPSTGGGTAINISAFTNVLSFGFIRFRIISQNAGDTFTCPAATEFRGFGFVAGTGSTGTTRRQNDIHITQLDTGNYELLYDNDIGY